MKVDRFTNTVQETYAGRPHHKHTYIYTYNFYDSDRHKHGAGKPMRVDKLQTHTYIYTMMKVDRFTNTVQINPMQVDLHKHTYIYLQFLR